MVYERAPCVFAYTRILLIDATSILEFYSEINILFRILPVLSLAADASHFWPPRPSNLGLRGGAAPYSVETGNRDDDEGVELLGEARARQPLGVNDYTYFLHAKFIHSRLITFLT